MDKKKKKEPGIKEWAIILGAGVLLLLLSVPDLFHKEKEQTIGVKAVVQQGEQQREEYGERMERKLEEMLRQINGVTDVKVMLTMKSTMEKVVLQDISGDTELLSESDGENGKRESQKITEEKKTVLAGDEPYLTKELSPKVEGVVAVISGGDGNAVLAITEAIQALFDVPAHKVKVINN